MKLLFYHILTIFAFSKELITQSGNFKNLINEQNHKIIHNKIIINVIKNIIKLKFFYFTIIDNSCKMLFIFLKQNYIIF